MRTNIEKENVETWLFKKGAIPQGCEKNEYWTYWKKTMQEYADEFACGFAEWKEEEKIELSFRTSRKGCIYVYKDMAYTTIELLEIYKQQINGKV